VTIGQPVLCRDGYAGSILSLLSGPHGTTEAMIVRVDGVWDHKIIVPLDRIERIDGEKVYLSIEKKKLRKLIPYRSDAALAASVRKALWADGLLRQTEYWQIRVRVEESITYLEGYVSIPSMKIRAERAALRADGIWKVHNCLKIDRELESSVERAIEKDPRIGDVRIQVGSQNGFITLSGVALNPEVRRAAQHQAISVPDVRGVLNFIRVPGAEIETESLSTLQPAIGAGIFATDLLLGVVEKVVINPDNLLVTAILAKAVFPDPSQWQSPWVWNNPRYSERSVIIPMAIVQPRSETDIFLRVNMAEAAMLETFDANAYGIPEEDWRPPYPYQRTDVLLSRQTEAS
jgi:osmotically-inducible protein OsmY